MYNKGIIYKTRGDKQMKMGLIGYGSVGKALIELIHEKKLPIEVKYILKSDGGILNKDGLNLGEIVDKNIKDDSHWIDNLSFSDLIDEDIDYLVELTSTNIKTGEPALSFIKLALSKGINVVTGNKGPILLEYKNLKSIAEKTGAYLGIGCTVGGALPSISCGKYDAAGANIQSIQGVLNGTTNYILNAMKCENKTYEEALEYGKEIGIVEKDPSLGKGFVIGHSYFCNLKQDCKDSAIKSILKYDIIPILKEYWFDDDNKYIFVYCVQVFLL